MANRGEELKRDTYRLLAEVREVEDPREAYARVQQRIRMYRNSGHRVPEELRCCERQLATEFMAESQGR
jgi:hypothetical protein